MVANEIHDLETLNANDFDALAIPGGFGVAKNLSDFAFKGGGSTILASLKSACEEFNQQNKPIAYVCIAHDDSTCGLEIITNVAIM